MIPKNLLSSGTALFYIVPDPIDAFTAATGVNGGPPPATVQATYCWPSATVQANQKTGIPRFTLYLRQNQADQYPATSLTGEVNLEAPA
jgi:hypothetical protein